MPRRRLGVVLLVPPPVDREIDGLRRACAPDLIGHVPPHLTLVPPVNVRESDVDEALALVADVAAASDELTLVLGPPATFHPVSPVLYLTAPGEGQVVERLRRLHHELLVGPLARRLDRDFVPHVTLADDLAPERIAAALVALADYQVEIEVDDLTVLDERRDEDGRRVWRPLADIALGRRAVVGRGGLELVLDEASIAGPEVERFLAHEGGVDPSVPDTGHGRPLVVTARHESELVGVAVGRVDDDRATLDLLLVGAAHRGLGFGRHLAVRFEDAARHRGATGVQ